MSTPGPVRWKLWMLALSWTSTSYVPGARFVTVLPFCWRVIVKPGPTVPTSIGFSVGCSAFGRAAAGMATSATTSTATTVTSLLMPAVTGERGRRIRRPCRSGISERDALGIDVLLALRIGVGDRDSSDYSAGERKSRCDQHAGAKRSHRRVTQGRCALPDGKSDGAALVSARREDAGNGEADHRDGE